jgi:hypothetical protein
VLANDAVDLLTGPVAENLVPFGWPPEIRARPRPSSTGGALKQAQANVAVRMFAP